MSASLVHPPPEPAMQTQVPATEFDPALDGVDHINVFSRGRTELGQLLSNFAHTPFTVPDHGTFASVEGYWYWLQCEDEVARERLRPLHGYRAKKVGRDLRVPDYGRVHDLEFRRAIARAIREKIRHHRAIAEMLAASTLPFAHYYVYGATIVVPADNEWILQTLDYFREKLRAA